VRVVVVVPGVRTTQVLRAIRTLFALARRIGARAFTFICLMSAGRWGGFSATCIAPPPRTAPPQVQAHNFAKAIRTDIVTHPVQGSSAWFAGTFPVTESWIELTAQMPKISLSASALTILWPVGARFWAS